MSLQRGRVLFHGAYHHVKVMHKLTARLSSTYDPRLCRFLEQPGGGRGRTAKTVSTRTSRLWAPQQLFINLWATAQIWHPCFVPYLWLLGWSGSHHSISCMFEKWGEGYSVGYKLQPPRQDATKSYTLILQVSRWKKISENRIFKGAHSCENVWSSS